MILETGDIVLVKSNKFSSLPRRILSKGIQLFEGVYYHHAMLAIDGEFWEADKKVRKIGYEKVVGDEILVLRLKKPLTDNEEYVYKAIIYEMEHASYDYWGVLFHFPIHILSGRRIWTGKTHKSADRKPYCTELAVKPINDIRGYFPQTWKVGAHAIITKAPLYYDVVAEGLVSGVVDGEILFDHEV